MNRIACAAIALALSGAAAEADEAIPLRGLFCQSEAQIHDASDKLRAGLPAAMVAESMNREGVNCVHADRIDYVVEKPYIIDEDSRGSLFTYEATLTAIRVGDNLRPIEPPLPIYFVRPDRIAGAVAAGKV